MHRPGLLFVCAFGLSCLAFGPAACSGGDSQPNLAASGGMASAAGHASASGAGHTSAGSVTASAGADAGSTNLGGAGGGTAVEAGMGGVALGGNAGELGGSAELGSSGATGKCASVVTSYELGPGIHVAACTPIEYSSNPPSSGEHYPNWADFGVYDFALPRGFWVHNLEHGAVVVTYNCRSGCESEVATAKLWLAGLAPDAACPAGPPRILLVPDPLLDTAWAASSWGFTLRADCFDAPAFSKFFADHAGQAIAPEATLCGTGVDFRAPGSDVCGVQ